MTLAKSFLGGAGGSNVTGTPGNAVIIDDDGVGTKDAGAPPGTAAVNSIFGRNGTVVATAGDYDASKITVDASGFDGNLANTDDTVQKVAQKLDDLVASGGGADLVGTGFGSDQRAAIQAKLDALPATGGRIVLNGQFRIDAPLTIPANAASATGEATFILEADGFCEIKAGGVQDFHIINFSGYAITQKLNFEVRGIRVIGQWDSFNAVGAPAGTVSITAASWAANVVTFTASGHGLTTGRMVNVKGVTPSAYNGDYIVTGVAGTQFSAALTSDPGTYTSGGTIGDIANSSYRGIKLDYANKVSVQDCWVDNVRGFGISIDKCTEGHVSGCTVTRNGKDGINVSNCVVTRIIDNTVYGCGDNGIASHSGVRTTGTIANSNGTIQTTSGSATVSITFPSSNSAVVGDALVITGSGVVGGLNMKGIWPIVTKPTGSTCTITHDLTATSTVGSGTPPGATFAFEIGSGWQENRQSVEVIGNKVENAFGIKCLGGPNVIVTDNQIKNVHGTGIHVGAEGSGGEGQIDVRSLTITGNQITDVIKKAYLSMSAPSDACILVDTRYDSVVLARIEGNILNCNRPKGSTTKPSDWMRGYTPPNGGPASPEHRWFSAGGWVDTTFSGEPTYQVIKGIEIRCKNGLDRNAIKVKNNIFGGLVANQAVRRYAPINGGTRVRPTIANASIANWETSLSGSYSLLNLDLAPAYGVGIRARKGAATSTQPTVTLECRFRKNDGIGVDGYVETSWGSGTAFATAQAVCSTDNTDTTTAITALPADAKRSMDVVPYGATSVNGNPFELISLELIVDHADNDSDYVVPVAQQIYDPTSLGVTLGFGVVPAATWATMTSGEKANRAWVVV